MGGASAGASPRACAHGGPVPAWSPTGKWIAWQPEGLLVICFSRPDGTHRQLLHLSEFEDPSGQIAWAKPNLLVTLGNYRITSDAFRPTPHVLEPSHSLYGAGGEAFSLDAKADLLATSFYYDDNTPGPVTLMRPGGATTTVGDSSAYNTDPSLAPDGKHVVWDKLGPRPSGIFKASINGTHVQRLARKGGGPLWSPSGRKIAFIAKGLWVMTASGSRKTMVSHTWCYGPGAETMAWSPNGRLIACVNHANRLVIFNLRTKRDRTVKSIGFAGQFVWAPNSNELLVEAGPHNALWRVPVRNGKPRVVIGTA